MRVVAMNCSIVYFLPAAFFSPGFADDFVFVAGVSFVSNALFDTSGFRSSGVFCAWAIETARAVARTKRRSEILRAADEEDLLRFIGFRFSKEGFIASDVRKAKRF
jgi:hypothetical protein